MITLSEEQLDAATVAFESLSKLQTSVPSPLPELAEGEVLWRAARLWGMHLVVSVRRLQERLAKYETLPKHVEDMEPSERLAFVRQAMRAADGAPIPNGLKKWAENTRNITQKGLDLRLD